jgi:hypothetical protein
MRKYWINTVSKDHVLRGVEGGFTQADHGKNARLKRLQQGDCLVFYSPKTQYIEGVALQAFTAMGKIIDAVPYQVEMTDCFHPWRRNLRFFQSHEAPIRPLIESLGFIQDPKRWGYPFRRGLFEVSARDFATIASAMGCDESLQI